MAPSVPKNKHLPSPQSDRPKKHEDLWRRAGLHILELRCVTDIFHTFSIFFHISLVETCWTYSHCMCISHTCDANASILGVYIYMHTIIYIYIMCMHIYIYILLLLLLSLLLLLLLLLLYINSCMCIIIILYYIIICHVNIYYVYI